MTLLLRAGRWLLGAAVVASVAPACFSAGGGNNPPTNILYFPTGLAVSANGSALYVVNSDFDLQWNGGTLQSYNLGQIRQDADALVKFNANLSPTLPPLQWAPGFHVAPVSCLGGGQPVTKDYDNTVEPGQQCAPPVDSTAAGYFRDAVIVGAFATDLQLAMQAPPPAADACAADVEAAAAPAPPSTARLLFPVRGTATLTYADVGNDQVSGADAFALQCGAGSDQRCAAQFQAGNNPNEPGNSRGLTMPGDPFGMALTEDHTAAAITHQTDTKTSLLKTGLGPTPPVPASMQFILDGLPTGGNGIDVIPHDPCAVNRCEDLTGRPITSSCTRPAFLQTSRYAAEVDLLRYYDDDGASLQRPFLQHEGTYSLTANSIGTDQRGIAIDPSPRFACKARARENGMADSQDKECGKIPARVYIASRAPPSLVLGEVGETATDGSYSPDALLITGTLPLTAGPSRVYLAPIIDSQGQVAMRVFVTCFDSNTIFVYDPQAQALENVIYTGAGPFAMAFDPMPVKCAAIGNPRSPVWNEWGCPAMPVGDAGTLGSYRFGYVANFTQSYLQLIDLDNSVPARSAYTFEQVVFTFGLPTNPKGQ